MPVKASRPTVSRPFSIANGECGEPGRRTRPQHPGLRRPRDVQIGSPQHQLARIDTPADQRPERHAQPQRIHADRQIRRPVSADVHLRRGQHRLRQQRQSDRPLDGDRLAERGRSQHLDRRAVAGPVEPWRHQPCGKQRQGCEPRQTEQPSARARHVRPLRRSRRRPASRSRTRPPGSVRRCRCRSAPRGVPSARSTHCRPTAPSSPPSSPNGATLRREETMTAVIGSRKRMRRTAPSPPRQRPSPPEPRRIAKRSSRTG